MPACELTGVGVVILGLLVEGPAHPYQVFQTLELRQDTRLVRVNGPLLEVEGLAGVAMSELVALGAGAVPGEVVSIRGGTVTVQAYEYTGGLAAGDPVTALGHPLSARLGPDLLGGVFDGLP